MNTGKILIGALLSVTASLMSSCGKEGPDAKDRPSVFDEMKAEITGKSAYKDLHDYNQRFEGNITAGAQASAPIALRVFSLPDRVDESREHNLDLSLVGELEIAGRRIAMQGEQSHFNYLRNESSHSALEKREFILLKPSVVMAADYASGTKVTGESQGTLARDAWLAEFDGAVDIELVAEWKNDQLVSGVVRKLICSGGGCSKVDVGSWDAKVISADQPEIIASRLIQTENFSFEHWTQDNTSMTIIRSRE